jgi:transposase
VRLIAPKFVTPYRMSGPRGKTDAADAAAICEALQRPAMRFVPLKSEQQQSQLMVHRARQGYVQARTACINRIRGFLAEFGHVLPLKADTVRRQAASLLEDLPGWANTVIGDLLSELHRLDERIAAYDRHVAQIAREDERARQLMQLPGIGHDHGHGGRGDDRQRARVQVRPAVRSLARADARTVQLRREDPIGAHHQGWGWLPAQPVEASRL